MKYKEISIGTKETLVHKVTQTDIDKFVDLSGDDNKLHVDKEFASKTSFKKPVVHGMIGASFISTIIGTKLPGDGALWFSQTLEFLLPVRIGDTINVTAEVTKKYDRDQIIELNIEILNQNRQIVTRGVSKVKVIEQETPEIKTVISKPRTKTALILGGTGGIGSATCLQLAQDGFNILIHYNNNKRKAVSICDEVLKLNRKAVIFQADIADEKSIDELINFGIRKFDHIDMFVNCAASAIPPIKAMDLLWADFIHQLELNIKVNIQVFKRIIPTMIANKYGKIVTIGTVYADKPNLNLTHYITAKAALDGFTKSMALELAPKGINVNMISPSVISTELTSDIPEKVKLLTIAQTPLRRMATPEDVAGAISFLVSEKSNFLSGENIRLNGGQIMI
ncbi:SDR family oxidoreductase [Bacteroidota bacterium]